MIYLKPNTSPFWIEVPISKLFFDDFVFTTMQVKINDVVYTEYTEAFIEAYKKEQVWERLTATGWLAG